LAECFANALAEGFYKTFGEDTDEPIDDW
jgi:hypothetical protein